MGAGKTGDGQSMEYVKPRLWRIVVIGNNKVLGFDHGIHGWSRGEGNTL